MYRSICIACGGMCAHHEEVCKSMSIAYGGMRMAIQIHDEKVGIVIRINTSA